MESRSQRRRRRLAKRKVQRPKQVLSQRARTILFRLVAIRGISSSNNKVSISNLHANNA